MLLCRHPEETVVAREGGEIDRSFVRSFPSSFLPRRSFPIVAPMSPNGAMGARQERRESIQPVRGERAGCPSHILLSFALKCQSHS